MWVMSIIIKFTPELTELVKSGKKWTTWRLFYEDKKSLKAGDVITLACRKSPTEVSPFGKADIISIKKTTLGELTPEDKEGHEPFTSDEDMYKTYEKYYRQPVNYATQVMIIKFKLQQ